MIGFVDDTNGSTTDFMLPHVLPLIIMCPLPHMMINAGMTCFNCLVDHSQKPNAVTIFSIILLSPVESLISVVALSIQLFEIYFNVQHNKPLNELSNYLAHKTLGVHKSPAGQSSTAF